MAAGSDTTEREESFEATAPGRLALHWVWPNCRVDSLQGARLTLGRDEASAIRLNAPGVSRHHAELYRQGPLYVLCDQGSTNGTWLDGRRIQHAPVAPGSVLRLGECVGVFLVRDEQNCSFTELAPGLFGGSELAGLLEPVKRVARSNLPIMVVGSTGTGKERVAHAIHHFSGRSGQFLAVNCAALPAQLAEAELFGYRRGAFTGAERASVGYFRSAHGGTLFLDEMPELSPALQAKLLRVVEDGQVLGLGETSAVKVDVRIVSACQRTPNDLVSAGQVREDLAARLAAVTVQLPSLADRRADIAPLFAQFLARHCGGRPPGVEGRLVEALCLHDWPQNVRELELVTKTLLVVHGHQSTLRRQHLPPHLAALCEEGPRGEGPTGPRLDRRKHDLQRLQQELKNNGGNIKAAADAIGVSRQRIYRLLTGTGPETKRGNHANDARD
jgi:DNA-binding NtrC family response regulator